MCSECDFLNIYKKIPIGSSSPKILLFLLGINHILDLVVLGNRRISRWLGSRFVPNSLADQALKTGDGELPIATARLGLIRRLKVLFSVSCLIYCFLIHLSHFLHMLTVFRSKQIEGSASYHFHYLVFYLQAWFCHPPGCKIRTTTQPSTRPATERSSQRKPGMISLEIRPDKHWQSGHRPPNSQIGSWSMLTGFNCSQVIVQMKLLEANLIQPMRMLLVVAVGSAF